MKVAGLLLAGGESRRMGQNKATLIFHGKPLWEHQLETLRSLGLMEIFVSARRDPEWRPNDTVFVPDEVPSRGPLSGIAAALKKTEISHLLVLAIDLPFMTESFLRSVVGSASQERGMVPQLGNRHEPLAAIYPREAAIEAGRALASADFSLRSLTGELVAFGKLRVVPVTQYEGKLFRNINEPADLKSC